MPRWNNIDDSTLDARTIYTGSCGFRDNDALDKVWSRTEKGFERAMRAAIMETARMRAEPTKCATTFAQTLRGMSTNGALSLCTRHWRIHLHRPIHHRHTRR